MRRFPSSHLYTAELIPMFVEYLKLCKVKAGETIVLFKDTEFNEQYPAACLAAARELKAETFLMTFPTDTKELSSPSILNAWREADMVIGMTSSIGWLYSHAHNEALAAGTRTLMIEEPVECLRRMFPCQEVKDRTIRGAEVLDRGSTLHITSEAGTDLTMSKVGRPGTSQYGISDIPGRWDHWPSGLVACAPVENSAEGVLVIDAGDIILNLGRYVSSPIRLSLKGGRITNFEGGADARLLEDYFASAKEDNAYIISHIGWGTDHRAQWHSIGVKFWEWGGMMDSESYLGNMQIAFGSNFSTDMGGQNVCRFHIDIPCRNHSIYIDDKLIIDKGVIIDDRIK